MRKYLAFISILIVSLGVLLTGSASATQKSQERSVLTGMTNPPAINGVPIPGLNNGESARIRVVDDGKSVTITGNGRGMGGAKMYVSLIYKDNACANVTYGNSGLSVNGAWQSHGSDRQILFARYEGAAYAQVKGQIQSVSIREITSVVIPPPNGPAAATLVPRACADVK